jgi:hypothetical protein
LKSFLNEGEPSTFTPDFWFNKELDHKNYGLLVPQRAFLLAVSGIILF